MLTLYLTEINMQTLAKLQTILNPAITLRLKDEQALELVREGKPIGRVICQRLGWIDPDLLARFTPSQRRVLLLLFEGKKNEEISQTLAISEKGVEYHLKKIYTKVGVRSRLQLVQAVIERSLG